MRFLPRSIVLWLGLLGLVFLIWAWASSVTTASTLLIGHGNIFMELISGEGEIRVATGRDPFRGFTGWSFETQTIRTPWSFFAPPAFSFSSTLLGDQWTTKAAYWLVISLYLTLWIIALGLRRWSIKRRTANPTPNVPRGTP